MHKKILIIPIITTLLTACGSGGSNESTNNIQPDSKKAPDLQALLDNTINSKEAKDAHITGIPLTFQCSGFNNNSPVSLATGKISDQSDAKLPIDAIYQIGSETKSFTAVVALQLESEGLFGSKPHQVPVPFLHYIQVY